MKPYVQRVTVKDVPYVRVVLRGEGSSRSLKAFGRDSLDAYLQAHMFVAAYQSLEAVLSNGNLSAYPDKWPGTLENLALSRYGFILGRDIVTELVQARAHVFVEKNGTPLA